MSFLIKNYWKIEHASFSNDPISWPKLLITFTMKLCWIRWFDKCGLLVISFILKSSCTLNT